MLGRMRLEDRRHKVESWWMFLLFSKREWCVADSLAEGNRLCEPSIPSRKLTSGQNRSTVGRCGV
jgi:hypothetical protein